MYRSEAEVAKGIGNVSIRIEGEKRMLFSVYLFRGTLFALWRFINTNPPALAGKRRALL